MTAKAGDRVKVTTSDEIKEGILMPNEETDSVVIKLDNGYNVGIDKKKVKEIKLIEKYKEKKETAKKEAKKDSKKPTIAILHTGGTIASKVDYSTGGVISSFSDEDFISMFPEIKDIANVKTSLISNMMSEDLGIDHYKKIAGAISKEIKNKVDGIIIGHGTDTLGITPAAMAFIFENLPIPVIFVGSQRSTDRGSTDAAANLICAAEFIAKTDFAGVGICMHESTSDNNCAILPATKTKKLHTSRRDAFKPVNDTIIARVDYETRKIELVKKDYTRKSDKKMIVRDNFESKVAVVRTYPNMFSDILDILTKKKYKGIVLEGTGMGHAPTNIKENLSNYNALKKFVGNGGIVVVTSQTVFGRVHRDIYVNTRRLGNIGCIFGQDMLTETAFTKLSWLLGNFKKDEVKELIAKNLRGEINDRLSEDEFLD
tara:strand:+ start:6004 stop:7290 length:1287 start_codon:yes stop_codon:yes gene_type:complete